MNYEPANSLSDMFSDFVVLLTVVKSTVRPKKCLNQHSTTAARGDGGMQQL
jgi:hypothetical protein